MIAFETDSHDPALNLGLEEYLFRSIAEKRHPELFSDIAHEGILILWQNGPSVIVGRHQNTQVEVCKAYLDSEKIPVVRRITGGGAVYHDFGNINYTFIKRDAGTGVDFLPFMRPVAEALKQYNIEVAFSSRNDLEVAGRKVSGSAQLRHHGTVLHHGTLLYDLNMEKMTRALCPDPDKISLKGLDSVRSRVINLKELLPPDIGVPSLKNAIREACGALKSPLPDSLLAGAHVLAETRYRAWEWNWGTSPAFSVTQKMRFTWGSLECGFRIEHGIITECSFTGDFFGNGIDDLKTSLKGVAWKKNTLKHALSKCELEAAFHDCEPETVTEFLCSLPDL